MSVKRKNKIMAVVAIGAVVGGGVFGASVYADKALHDIYRMDGMYAKNIKSKKVNFNMGIFSGDVTWEAEMILDLCNPEGIVKIIGSDHITRGLSGYNIQSKINVESSEIKKFFDNKPIVNLDVHVSWFGQSEVKLDSPSVIKNDGQSEIDWAGFKLTFKANQQGGNVYYDDLVLNVPRLHVKQDSKEFTIKNIVYKSNHGSTEKIIPSTSELTINAIQANVKDNIDLNSIKYKSEIIDHDNKLSVIQAFSIGGATGQMYTLNKLVLNSQIQDIDKVETEKSFATVKKLQRQCLPTKEKMTKAVQAISLVLEKGLKFNSKENLIEVNGRKLSFNIDGKLNSGTYPSDFNKMINIFPQKVMFTYGVEVDKGLIQEARPDLEEKDIQDMAKLVHGEVTDSVLQFSGKFENGKFN